MVCHFGDSWSFPITACLQGWCPPVPLLRRLVVRTSSEINYEKEALKELRSNNAEGLF